jgi:Holliday junction resolvasome, helicase subunit
MNENLSATPLEDEMMVEKSLRPQFFNQYIGQDKVKEQLEIFIKAARLREEVLDHVLLFGLPAWGKQPWPLLFRMS